MHPDYFTGSGSLTCYSVYVVAVAYDRRQSLGGRQWHIYCILDIESEDLRHWVHSLPRLKCCQDSKSNPVDLKQVVLMLGSFLCLRGLQLCLSTSEINAWMYGIVNETDLRIIGPLAVFAFSSLLSGIITFDFLYCFALSILINIMRVGSQ